MSGNLTYAIWLALAFALYFATGWFGRRALRFLRGEFQGFPYFIAAFVFSILVAGIIMLGVPIVSLLGIDLTSAVARLVGVNTGIGQGIWFFCFWLLPLLGLLVVPVGWALNPPSWRASE